VSTQTLAVSRRRSTFASIPVSGPREQRKAGFLGSVFPDARPRGGMMDDAAKAIKGPRDQHPAKRQPAVETLSGGQRASGRSRPAPAAFGSQVVILDEPTAALGVRESNHGAPTGARPARQGLGVILISHKHAPGLAGRGPHPHSAPRWLRRGHHPAEATPAEEGVAIMTGGHPSWLPERPLSTTGARPPNLRTAARRHARFCSTARKAKFWRINGPSGISPSAYSMLRTRTPPSAHLDVMRPAERRAGAEPSVDTGSVNLLGEARANRHRHRDHRCLTSKHPSRWPRMPQRDPALTHERRAAKPGVNR
jgi:hypothetical protein